MTVENLLCSEKRILGQDTIKYSALLDRKPARDCGIFNHWFIIEVVVCDHVVTDLNVPLRFFHPKYKPTVTPLVGSRMAL